MIEKRVCLLPGDEGSVVLRDNDLQSNEDEIALNTTLSSAALFHGGDHVDGGMVGHFCGGKMSVIPVSESKQVLHCARCGLRKQIPHQAVSVLHLKRIR